MTIRRPVTGGILAALLAVAATAAHATAFNADGTAEGQQTSTVTEFGPDHRVVSSTTTFSSFDMNDETNPMNNLKGDCFGTIEVRGGAIEGGGYCVFDGLEGDRLLIQWQGRRVDPRGRTVGYWTVNAGTGLWLQASGGGTFVSQVNPANGATTNTLRGAITIR